MAGVAEAFAGRDVEAPTTAAAPDPSGVKVLVRLGRVVSVPNPQDPREEGEVATKERVATPRLFRVIFHNDDFTTMDFVVEVLRVHFHKTDAEAVHVMLTVHKKGAAVAGVYPRDVAETKVARVMQDARKRGMPLLLTTEPD